MSFNLIIDKKNTTNCKEQIKIKSTTDILQLNEVKEIRNSIQEHLLLVGLDNRNNLRHIRLLGIGTSSYINIDSKDIIRTALTNICDKVILVHNHPSNSLTPSFQDKHMTNKVCKMLKVFNINLLDHIIVTENSYVSMFNEKYINKDFIDKDIEIIDSTLLVEENERLKKQISLLKNKIKSKTSELEL